MIFHLMEAEHPNSCNAPVARPSAEYSRSVMGDVPSLWTFIYRIFCHLTLGEEKCYLEEVSSLMSCVPPGVPAGTHADFVSSVPGAEEHQGAPSERQ